MNKSIFVLALLGTGILAQAGTITDNGDQYDASTSATGSLNITAPSGSQPYTAPDGPSFCVTPGNGCAEDSGLFGSVSFSDLGNGDDQLSVTFFGSTDEGSGTFDLILSGFNTLNGTTITDVTATGGEFIDGIGSFGLNNSFGTNGFTVDSIDLEGSTNTAFDAENGQTGVTFTFDVATEAAATPEPGSILLAITGIAGVLGAVRLRKR